jgi:hypothetical protein
MATKKTTAKPAVKQTETIENTAVATAPVKQVQPKKPTWEIKDRTYILKGDTTPLRYILQSRNSRRSPLLWFDEKTAEQKEIRYATNQNSVFVQEQKGESILGSITFEDGSLFVPKEKQNLQKLLSLYHPSQGKKYIEFKPAVLAEEELDSLELELEAMIAAKNKPDLFLELANDENVPLRNFAIKATEEGIISLSQDQRYFSWAANDRKLMTVPFDENPYSAMAAFFKTDEGVEIYRSIEKKTA